MDNNILLTTGELAELTGLSAKQINGLAARGVLSPAAGGTGRGCFRFWTQEQAVRIAAAVAARREADLLLAGERPVPPAPALREAVDRGVRKLSRRGRNAVGRNRGLCLT